MDSSYFSFRRSLFSFLSPFSAFLIASSSFYLSDLAGVISLVATYANRLMPILIMSSFSFFFFGDSHMAFTLLALVGGSVLSYVLMSLKVET